MEVVDLGLAGEASAEEWEAAIERVLGEAELLFMYGSRYESSSIGGGWWGSRGGSGSVAVGSVAIV